MFCCVCYLRCNLDYNLYCRTIDRRLHEIYSVANGVRTDNTGLISVQTISLSSSQPPPAPIPPTTYPNNTLKTYKIRRVLIRHPTSLSKHEPTKHYFDKYQILYLVSFAQEIKLKFTIFCKVVDNVSPVAMQGLPLVYIS